MAGGDRASVLPPALASAPVRELFIFGGRVFRRLCRTDVRRVCAEMQNPRTKRGLCSSGNGQGAGHRLRVCRDRKSRAEIEEFRISMYDSYTGEYLTTYRPAYNLSLSRRRLGA